MGSTPITGIKIIPLTVSRSGGLFLSPVLRGRTARPPEAHQKTLVGASIARPCPFVCETASPENALLRQVGGRPMVAPTHSIGQECDFLTRWVSGKLSLLVNAANSYLTSGGGQQLSRGISRCGTMIFVARRFGFSMWLMVWLAASMPSW